MTCSNRSMALFAMGLSVALCQSGCEQGSTQEFRKFTEVPEEIRPVELVPLVAPKPEMAVNLPPMGASAVGDEIPLVAVKPVLASNSSELRQNLDTKPLSSGPQEIKLLVPEKAFRPDASTGVTRLTYDDFDLLKVLNMDPVPPNAPEYFPSWLNSLDGKRVRVRGFMYPPGLEEGITGFMLARDNQICCMGREAKIYDLVNIFLKDGESTRYIQNRPFDVVGTFRINPAADNKTLYQLYEIEEAVVIER